MRSLKPLLLALSLLPAVAFAQGMLLPTGNGRPLAIKSQRVNTTIQDGTAVTRVEQTFLNEGPSQLEAYYVFPMPKGAALSEFYLWINGKKTKAEILEKEKATSIYEGIVRRLQDPGLLEYVDTDVFRVRVFPVPARGEQKIELAFSQVLEFSNGLYRYHYPLGATGKGQAPDWRVVTGNARGDFTFTANIATKSPLRAIYSPTHNVYISRKGEVQAVVGMEEGTGADLTKDLDLYFSVSDKAVGLNLLTYRVGDEPGYFIALISPKTEVQANEVSAKRVTFVIDTSGSMQGDRMRIAKDALKYCVTRLNPQDTFNIVRFSTDVEPLFQTLQTASKENVDKAVRFVSSMEALGGTAIDEALVRGLADNKGDSSNPHLLIFITDGQPTVGDTDEAVIASHAKEARKNNTRLFTFGVGEDLNARLLDRLAAEGNGASDFVRDGKEFETNVSGFYDKVSHPVLADVSLDLSSMEAYDVYPRKLPDLFKGTQLVVMGRFRKPGDAKVVLAGSLNGAKKTFEYGTTLDPQSKRDEFIPRLWAIRKVGFLLEEIRLRGERPELREEVTALGKKFGIVTPYTSYLVVEDQPMNVAQNRPPNPPPVFHPWEESRGGLKGSASGGGSADDSFDKVFGAPKKKADSAPMGAPMVAPADTMSTSEGKQAVAVSRATKQMKEEEKSASADEPVRVASGKTFVYRNGVWTDSEAVSNPGTQLKIKFLSKAYFALLDAKPELKAALSLGDHVVVMIARGKSIAISDGGEEDAAKVSAFLK
ncbi:MAG: VIT domain-containing protein [Myxococcaceae bacterium]